MAYYLAQRVDERGYTVYLRADGGWTLYPNHARRFHSRVHCILWYLSEVCRIIVRG